jgi:hypothetical protein
MAVKRPDPKLVKVIADLQKLGYVKVVALKKNVASVYVPKSDRAIELKTIAKKMRGKYDTSGKAQNAAGSSIGGVYLKNGMIVGAKPDASKSLNTDQQETLQGIFIAAKMINPKTKYSMADLQAAQKNVQSKFTIDDLFEIAGKGWLESSRLAAEATYDFLGRQNVMVCQRSKSKFVTNISNAATKLIRESGKQMGIDKWNPADIWLVKKSFLNHNFKQYTSIIDLNEFIYESYKSKDIVGVSLKATKKKASVKIFNDGIKQEFKYEGFRPGASFVKSMSNEIFFTGGKITFRLFGKPADVIGEINGKHAAGGKVGGGPLFKIMRDFDKSFQVPKWKDIMKMYETKPEFVISHLYKDMQKLAPAEANGISEDDYAKAIEEKGNTETYVISKWHANEVVHSFERMKSDVRDDCIAAILGYASSSTEISSIFIKVS